MRRKPGPGYSLDRYPDPTGNYEPGNCRWATAEEQARNKPSVNVNVTIEGERRCVYGPSGWLAKLGISDCCYRCRINKGMLPMEALTAPKIKGRPRPKLMITHDGRTLTPEEWGLLTGIHPVTLRGRIKSGWSVAKSLTTIPRGGSNHRERD